MREADFLVGPTASGKSAVAQLLAEQLNRPIVSADSMNVYRGMDIGTAKPSPEERSRVDVAGIDLVEPTEPFCVADYLDAVRPEFESNRKPIVAGGTGLYVKCLTEGFDDVAPENPDLRAELEALDDAELAKRAKNNAPELYRQLTEDDRKNPRRLIRILEKVSGDSGDAVPPGRSWNSKPKPKLVGLQVDRKQLVRRIEKRVESMYEAGLLDEAKKLIHLELSPTAMQAIGYAEAFSVLRNEMTMEEAKEKTIIRTRQLAKRQMTWFRNQLNVEWIDTAQFKTLKELADAVSCAWENNGPTPIRI